MRETLHTPNGPAPLVTPGDAQLVGRRPGRELFPSSWLRRQARIQYGEGKDLSGTLLEYCSVGLVVATNGSKTRIAWDALQLVELASD